MTGRAAVLFAALLVSSASHAASAAQPGLLKPHLHAASAVAHCGEGARASAGKGNIAVDATRACDVGTQPPNHPRGPDKQPVVVLRTVDCGPPQVAGQLRPGPGNVCAQVRNVCDVATTAQLRTDPHLTTTATEQRNPDGSWQVIGTGCAVHTAQPQLTALMVKQQVRKLVPHPQVGIAPPGGATLVNIQTLLWADTAPAQSLGTVTLLGHRVALHVRVAHIDWDFGDGNTETTNTPEPRYNPATGCRTVTCPGYWGHTYRSTGPVRISATVTWTGQYRVDAGAWLNIPDTVTGPTATAALTVRQARGILVPDTNQH